MDNLQIREKEIFETLKRIEGSRFVVIGGYAINAYTLPRFSVDCDIVVKDKKETNKINKILIDLGYSKTDNEDVQYFGVFERFEKEIKESYNVSIDILIKEVIDRQTDVVFSAEWVFDNSESRKLRGKTVSEDLNLRIINIDALFVMKFICCRSTDIRDIFMLAPYIKDKKWVKEEITKRYDFKDRFLKIKEKITSKKFKDSLQGVFGYIDNNVFEKHQKAVLRLEKIK